MIEPQERRAFLALGLAGTAVGLVSVLNEKGPNAVGAAEPVELDVIDCHTHFYDPVRPEGVPWPAQGSSLYRTVLPQHLRELKQFRRVTGTVVVEASPLVEDNAWLLSLAKSDPFIVGVVGSLTPGRPEFAAQLQRFAADPLFRGIRVSSRWLAEASENDAAVDLKRLADHDLALDVNGGPDGPAIVARFAAAMPTLRVVLNHIGNVHITADSPPQGWQDGITAAARRPNVFCKISALVEGAARDGRRAPDQLGFYRPYLDVVWNAFGDERVLYGSNWPVSERAADYEMLQRIALEYAQAKGDRALAGFCSLNAKRAYQWIDRPGRR